MAVTKNLSKILLAILIVSIIVIPIITNQHSLYRLKTMNNEEGIQKCVNEGYLTREKCEEIYSTLTEEYVSSSPSMAAAIVIGGNANGWKEWKNSEGKTLNEIKRQNSD